MSIQNTSNDRDIFNLCFALVVSVIVIVNLIIVPSRFADYDTYLFYLDSIWYFPSSTPLFMEPLSRAYLLVARGSSATTEIALNASHYILGAVYLIGVYALLKSRRDCWQALLVIFAITGPLLALVTVRATPAYLFVALAVLAAERSPGRSAAFMFLALCFHISAALAVAPWALLLLRNKLPAALRAERPGPLIALGLIVAAMFLFFGQTLISSILSVVENVPVLNKYMAYSQDYGPRSALPPVTSISHYIFFAFSIGYAIVFLISSDSDSRAINLYVVASLPIYVTLFFGLSPVAALRQACFWQLPMTVMLPWKRLGVTSAVAPLAAAASLAFFLFQLSEVYQ